MTLPGLIISSFGDDITIPDDVAIAKKGFTAQSLQFPPEGMTLTTELKLISGHTASDNSRTQILNLSRLEVDPNSGTSAIVSIRPTDNFLYREQSSGGSMEGLDDLDINGSIRNSHVFTSTTLGRRGLRLTGQVSAYVASANVVTPVSGSSSPQNQTTADGLGPSAVLSAMSSGTDYGSWPVKITIQALTTHFQSFTLKAGSPVPDDTTIVNPSSGAYIKFSDMELADGEGNFLSDFVVDPSLHSIVGSFETTDVHFNAYSEVPEGTIVELDTYHAPTTTTNGVTLSSSTIALYKYGQYPQFTFKFPRGTVVENTFPILDGFKLPGGHVIPAGSTTSDGGSNAIDAPNLLTVNSIIASTGFQMMKDLELTGVVPTDKYITTPAGMTSRRLQPVPDGFTTTSTLDLDEMIIPASVSAESEITLKSDYPIVESIKAAFGSIFKAGSVLYRGSQSIGGALITGSLVIDAGSTVTDRVELSSPFVVEPSTYGSNSQTNTLQVGTVLKGPFQFPVGTHIPSGNTLPNFLKVVTSMGVTLAQGMILTAGSIFGTNGTICGDVGFDPQFKIPALSTLNGSFSFPAGTKFLAGLVSNVITPVPNHFVFPTGTTIPTGTAFQQGASIPNIGDIVSQAGTASNGISAAGPLTKTAEGDYLIIKAHTTFLPGFQFPVGTILSYAAMAGFTSSKADAKSSLNGSGTDGTSTRATMPTYTLAAASYSLDETQNAPGQDEYTFTCGVETLELIVMLSDTTLPYDVLIPVSDIGSDIGSFLSFNEKFSLVSDIVLTTPYTVNGSNNVYWPAGIALPSDFTLTGVFSSTFTNTTISKDIQFNVATNADFINGVMSSTSTLRFPPAGYTLDKKLKLAVDQAVSSTGSTSTKSFVQLAAGTKLQLVGTGANIPLAVKMQVNGNFTVAVEFTNFPRFELPSGIILLAGMKTPGQILIGGGSLMPSNLLLTSDVTLSTDATIDEDGYTLLTYSKLASGSVLARETEFTEGAHLSNVSVSPILSLSKSNVFMIEEFEELSSNIQQPYLYDSVASTVHMLDIDDRGSLSKIAALQAAVEALQAAAAQ